MSVTFRILVVMTGSVIVLVGCLMWSFGPGETGNIFQIVPEVLLGRSASMENVFSVDGDSELRFYSVFFAGFGCWLCWLGYVFPKRHPFLLGAFAVFFIGGLGRYIGMLQNGRPSDLFWILMWVELGGPIVLTAIYFRALRTVDR